MRILKKGILIGFLVLLVTSNASFASKEETYGDIEIKEIVSVYDGDTFKCNIKNYPILIGKNITVRISGIDTPEMTDKRAATKAKAIKAKEFVIYQLKNAKKIELRNMRRDKYFRILADVYIDEKNIAPMLIHTGLAKSYDGGTKEKW